MSPLLSLWKARWGVGRFAIAAFIAWALAVDAGPRLARLHLAALPDFDFAREVASLREQGRFGESLMIADSGLAMLTDPATRAALEAERARTLAEQSSWLRIARDFGFGALSGRGESIESLAGAVSADLLLVGDLRDLAIQGAKLAVDGEADPVIAGLSALGVATTLAPEVDWALSTLKIARRTGALTRGMGDAIVTAIRTGDKAGLDALLANVRRVGAGTSPATTLRSLRAADSPDDVADLAKFLERHSAAAGATSKSGGGALALHVLGPEARLATKGAAKAGTSALAAEAVVIKAATKGDAGATFLRRGGARMLLKPHPLLGIAKAIYKGNAEALAARIAERLDPLGWWILPLACGWAFAEGGLLARRLWPRSRHPLPAEARQPRAAAA